LDEGFTRDASTVNGKLYSVPITGTSPNNTPLLWIRKDWLDKVGLDVPATMDEFMEVARAFTNNDPDGNGKKDTYGLAMNKTFEGGTSNLNGFLNGFDAYFNTWIKGGDGLVFSTVQPEMKDALLAMQKMYAEGLVDPEFSVKDPVKAGELTVSGRVGMLYGRTWACYVQIKQNSLKDLDAEWLPFPIPSVDGTSGPQASGSVNNMTFFGVNKKFAHPEAAVKLVNFYADNYFFAESPKAWTDFIQYDKGDGTSLSMIHYNVIEPSTPWKDYNQYVQLQEAIKVNDRSILRPYVQVVYDSVADYIADPTLRDYLPSYLQVGPVGSQSIVQKYRLNDQVVYDEFIGFSPPTMLEKESTLDAKVLEVFTRIIMGEPVEEFDQLVKDWNALGGEQITKEVNDWYKTR
jgi:putative aldouronate transport system substrate-binding protein